MSEHTILIACRDNAEAEKIRAAIGQPSATAFFRSTPLLDRLAMMHDACLVLTSLCTDETAEGLVTKAAIVHPSHVVMYANRCDHALNIARLYGCGCAAILGPDELDLLPGFLDPPQAVMDELVMPPFFIDDDESSLRPPDTSSLSNSVHVTFLGSQALMSCCNALLNIKASPLFSFSCVGPSNAWAREHLVSSLLENTLWTVTQRPAIVHGSCTLCNDFNVLASLEPTARQFILCHGLLSADEIRYMDSFTNAPRIFQATMEGYVEKTVNSLDSVVRPEKLWDTIISSLFTAD